MALYAVHIANGTSSNTSLLRLFGRYLSGTGVVQPGAFTVSAQASPNMTVKVSGSAILDDLFIRPTFGGTYHGWNTGTENVTIPSNATGITKIDHVVAYIDTAFSSGTADNPGALVLTTVRGTGTAAPSDAEINTALSSKPWIRLAEVTVANGASSINSGNITDKRTFARVDGGLLNPASVPVSALATGLTTGYTFNWFNGASAYTFNSTSPSPIGSYSGSFTFTGGPVLIVMSVSRSTNPGGNYFFGVRIGSTDYTVTPTTAGSGLGTNGSLFIPAGTITAGSATVKPTGVAQGGQTITFPAFENMFVTITDWGK